MDIKSNAIFREESSHRNHYIMVQIDDLLYSIFFQKTALYSYKYRQYFEKRPCVHDRIVFQVSILRNSACHRCTITHVCRLKNTRWKVKLASAGQNRCWKLGQQNAICWNYLVLFRDCGLDHIFLGIKLFLFFKIKSWSF